MNKVLLSGYVSQETGEPIIMHEGRTYLTKFSLATVESYKDKNGNWQEDVTFHNIEMWGKGYAKLKLNKGDYVELEGRIKNTRSNNKYFHAIRLDGIKIIRRKKTNQTAADNQQEVPPPVFEDTVDAVPPAPEMKD